LSHSIGFLSPTISQSNSFSLQLKCFSDCQPCKLGLGLGSLFVFYLTHGSPIIKIFAGEVLPSDSLVQFHYFQSGCISVSEGKPPKTVELNSSPATGTFS